jgi:hypothetical protein
MSVTATTFEAVMADLSIYARFAGMLTQTPEGLDSARELLETVNHRLADVVADPALPPATYCRLVELRDAVGSHLLAAASLDDVVPERARQLLARASDLVVQLATPAASGCPTPP